MDITLHADRHQMDGFQRLTYYNNSPDTLHQVFYHLYFNAFQPNSMMAERNRHLPDPDSRIVPRIWNLGPDEIGYHRVESLTQNGRPVSWDVTDTVMRVDLAEPIPPGDSAVFEMRFHSQVPLQTRRSGRDNREGIDYSMSQWYPKIAAYDERGWHADPYVGREFYAPYGTFDVRLTLPAEYVVGGTGVLQNPDEVGHGYGDGPSATDGLDSLTWHFRAEDVHDFAWAADPDYIHEQFRDEQLGITYHLLYQPDVAERWEPMREWVPAIIRFFSEQYGLYPYPQFTVAQAGDGGMEYPMVNFITGRRSPMSLLGVTAHEAAHEWFYGALGTNEADYAWMDEGFTTYATTEVMAHVLGRPDPSHVNSHLSVIGLKEMGLLERFNTPADWFTTNAAYGVASYPGGAMIVDMLGYVISDSLRDAWIREYVRRFAFRHPNPYDLEKLAEDISGLRLDWYFEQFANMTRTLDYAVAGLDSRRSGFEWISTITLRRGDDVVMPVDVRLTLEDGSTQWVNIPLGIMQGHKPVPEGWIVAEPWLWTFPEYTLELNLPAQVVKAEIDPLGRTPDVNRLNNTSALPIEARFLHPPEPSWFTYGVGYRPLVQYADNFGVAVGAQVRGTYIFDRHHLQAMVKLWPQVLFSGGDEPELDPLPATDDDLSALDGIDYELRYQTGLDAIGARATASVSLRKHLGFLENVVSLSRPLSGYGAPVRQVATASVVHQYAAGARAFEIDDVSFFRDVHMLSARFTYRIGGERSWIATVLEAGSSLDDRTDCLRTPVGNLICNDASRASATHFTVDAARSVHLGPFVGQARLRYGLGADNLALHKRFRLGAASFEEAWRNDAFRSVSAAFDNALADAHLAAVHGPGPVAYLLRAAEDGPGPAVSGLTLSGTRVLAGTISLSTGELGRHAWIRPLRVQGFAGLGTAWGRGTLDRWNDRRHEFDTENLVADAGLGVSYDVSGLRPLDRWIGQSDVLSGLKVVALFPVWASDPELISADEEAFDFRWLIGIQVD